jgi:hypothetical protein
MPRKDTKARVVLSIDAEIWNTFKANLDSYGLPKGSASYLVSRYMERINIECSPNSEGISPQLEMYDFDHMAEIVGRKKK